jgi:glucan phosphoethanolaminetransferase (alkaline phosphatase superfamily)
MNPFLLVTICFVIGCPIAWLASEFQERRWPRILLGIAAIASCFGVAALVGALEMWNANAWYGNATKELMDTTVAELEAGNQTSVLASLKELQRRFEPSYENRAEYDKIVETAVQRMKSANRQDRRETSRNDQIDPPPKQSTKSE